MNDESKLKQTQNVLHALHSNLDGNLCSFYMRRRRATIRKYYDVTTDSSACCLFSNQLIISTQQLPWLARFLTLGNDIATCISQDSYKWPITAATYHFPTFKLARKSHNSYWVLSYIIFLFLSSWQPACPQINPEWLCAPGQTCGVDQCTRGFCYTECKR